MSLDNLCIAECSTLHGHQSNYSLSAGCTFWTGEAAFQENHPVHQMVMYSLPQHAQIRKWDNSDVPFPDLKASSKFVLPLCWCTAFGLIIEGNRRFRAEQRSDQVCSQKDIRLIDAYLLLGLQTGQGVLLRCSGHAEQPNLADWTSVAALGVQWQGNNPLSS